MDEEEKLRLIIAKKTHECHQEMNRLLRLASDGNGDAAKEAYSVGLMYLAYARKEAEGGIHAWLASVAELMGDRKKQVEHLRIYRDSFNKESVRYKRAQRMLDDAITKRYGL